MPRKSGHFFGLLEQLGKSYRHVKQEHQREGVSGSTRHGLERRMQVLAERFERLVSHWVADDDSRAAWLRYFYRGGPLPEMSVGRAPPEFCGITDGDSRVEVCASDDGGYDVIVDGATERHEAIPWYLEPDMIEPIWIGDHLCHEVFDAPPEAVRELELFLRSEEGEPPWRWASALFEDGLIDDHFALTTRGSRLMRKSGARAGSHRAVSVYGVLVADAARARGFVLRARNEREVPTLEPLVEVFQATRPDVRAPDRDLFTDSRPGLRREGGSGSQHGVSDRREAHRRNQRRRFAGEVVAEMVQVWREYGVTDVVLTATPAMLGAVRRALAQAERGPMPWRVRELDRDLSRLSAPELHDALAVADLLPVRGRLPPLYPVPGAPL